MSELTDFRSSRDHYMNHDPHSPLTADQKREFRGMAYYDERPGLRFVLDPERYGTDEIVEMQTSTGEVTQFERWGRVSFDVDAELTHLTLYKDADSDNLFLPFADSTSGEETYGSGRYLDVEMLPDGRAVVDFNYAYNPYCAYNESWSCPLTPWENRVKVPIRAGEKNFEK